jgi:hypothetical protein
MELHQFHLPCYTLLLKLNLRNKVAELLTEGGGGCVGVTA